MTQLSTRPPAERDLPPGRSMQLRAQVMERADARPHGAGRRLAPVAAAAVVLAVAGGTALVANDHTGASSHHPTPGTSPTTRTAPRPVVVGDASLVKTCAPGGRLLVRFNDALGTYAKIWQGSNGGYSGEVVDCYADPPGTVRRGGKVAGTNLRPRGIGGLITPLKAGSEVAVRGMAHALMTIGPDGLWSGVDVNCLPIEQHLDRKKCPLVREHDAFGIVAPGVARVVVTWAGRAPVTAAVSDGYFAARTIDRTAVITPVDPKPHVQAYDKDGHLIGRG